MIDILRLYQDYGIRYETAGHKHVSRGWVGVPCSFCTGNPGYHLGFCIDSGSRYGGNFVCWRCGGKSTVKVIANLTNTTETEARRIIGKYSKGDITTKRHLETPKRKIRSRCHLPLGTSRMTQRQRKYLYERNFSPERLEEEWKLLGTGPVGPFKHRIIIPIYMNEKLMSYQGRDITEKSDMKYKACPQELEAKDHKKCLYGIDKVSGSSVVVVEGVTDVWRLGPGAVATFGIKFTMAQVRLLSRFKRVIILFDTDPEAVQQANQLGQYLSSLGVKTTITELWEGDPADLSDPEAREMMGDFLK